MKYWLIFLDKVYLYQILHYLLEYLLFWLTLIYPPHFEDFQCWKYQLVNEVNHIYCESGQVTFNHCKEKCLSFIQKQNKQKNIQTILMNINKIVLKKWVSHLAKKNKNCRVG